MNSHKCKKVWMYRLALVIMFMVLTTALAVAQEATIASVSHDLDVMQDGARGMLIHVKFYVDDMVGKDGRVNVYFYKSDGTKLKDFDGKYLTTNGYVATWEGFTADYASTRFKDFTIFMPYSQLHLCKGKYNLKYDVTIEWKEGNIHRQLASSNYYNFALDDEPKKNYN